MTKPTGRPPGRPKGSLNRASREQRERAAASGMLPHDFLLAVTRGEVVDGYTPTFAERLEAAKAAAPFFAPKLSAVEATLHGMPLQDMSEAELDSRIAELEVRIAGIRRPGGETLQ